MRPQGAGRIDDEVRFFEELGFYEESCWNRKAQISHPNG